MAEKKNTQFNRPGGYATPKGAALVQAKAALELKTATDAALKARDEGLAGTTGGVILDGDALPPHQPKPIPKLKPTYAANSPDTRLYVGDCRDVLASIPEKGEVDLIFADPPFNWDVPYDGWKDGMPRRAYERFTYDWLDGCVNALAPHGALWVNIPDDTAAEIVMHLKRRGLTMINWCIWHFRFGQHRESSFISSKVHALYFAKDARNRIWNGDDILELSDRASIYADPRTMSKECNKGLRVPMDVWYGKYWGRIQGNNRERRHNHHNQIPEVYLERVIKACSNGAPAFTSRDRQGAEHSQGPGPKAQRPSLVLDPFCGSGTTSTVARALGRRSITIEFSEKNAASAWERITKVGMVQREDVGPTSSAIFKARRKTPAANASKA